LATETARVLRYEVKSVLPALELPRVRAWLRLHPAGFRTAYPPRLVQSLYLDSPDRHAFVENLSGAACRRKLRLRWYGEATDRIEATLEMKCKQGLVGWKESERVSGPLSLAGRRWPDLLGDLRRRLSGRSRIFLDLAGAPVLLVRYRRDYLVSADGHVRATVDREIETVDQTRHSGPRFGPVNSGDSEIVLEVKADEARRTEIERVLDRWPLRISRNSKFTGGRSRYE
jgi:hypothetical protein